MGFICCQCNILTQGFLMFHFWKFLFLMCARCLLVWFFSFDSSHCVVNVLWSNLYCVLMSVVATCKIAFKMGDAQEGFFPDKNIVIFSLSFTLSPPQKFSLDFSLLSYDKINLIQTDEAFFDKWQLIKRNLLSLLLYSLLSHSEEPVRTVLK